MKVIKKSDKFSTLKNKWLYVLIALLVLAISSFYLITNNNSPATSLDITLWAWERPETLLFLKNGNVKVAFLAGSVILQDNKIHKKPRLQPLKVNKETPLIAVVRIDNFNDETKLTDNVATEIADFIVKMCSAGNQISGCQIDFDATVSERDFYKNIIFQVINQLSKSLPLSITALVSWCNQNSWIEDLPIDEAVPMFYRLGADDSLIRSGSTNSGFMASKYCQDSVGVSTDEKLPEAKYLKNRKIYIFNPDSWTKDDFSLIIKNIENKQLSEAF